MKKVTAVEIEPGDIENANAPNFYDRLKQDVFVAAVQAEVVIYSGDVIKNRLGKVTKVLKSGA